MGFLFVPSLRQASGRGAEVCIDFGIEIPVLHPRDLAVLVEQKKINVFIIAQVKPLLPRF
jgi:hypothetical protein